MNNETLDISQFDFSPSTSEIIEIIYQMAFFLIGAPLNIHALYKTRRVGDCAMESRLVRFSRQLMIAHLLVLTVYGGWRVHWLYTTVWIYGDLLCRLYSFLASLPFHLWSNLVAAIAIDMLCCISCPLSSYQHGSTRVNCLISGAWLLAIICALPMAVLRGTVQIAILPNGKVIEQCYRLEGIFPRKVLYFYHVFHVLTVFYAPLIVIIVSYSLIGVFLKRRFAERESLQGKSCAGISSVKARFLRVSFAIIATFFLSWLPYQIFALLVVICETEFCAYLTRNFNWLQAIIIASTCINPFLYRFPLGHNETETYNYCDNREGPGGAHLKHSLLVRQNSTSDARNRIINQRRLSYRQPSEALAADHQTEESLPHRYQSKKIITVFDRSNLQSENFIVK